MTQRQRWVRMVVKMKTVNGEERVERMSFYKEDRVDEVMNECMRRISRGQGSRPAKKHQLFTLLPNSFSHTL